MDSKRAPHYLEAQVVQGRQACLPSLHSPDHLWVPVALKDKNSPKVRGLLYGIGPTRLRRKQKFPLMKGRVSIILWKCKRCDLTQPWRGQGHQGKYPGRSSIQSEISRRNGT
jgi:hypothetical protein